MGTNDRQFYRIPVRVAVRFGPLTPEAYQAITIHRAMWEGQGRLEEQARAALEEGKLPDSVQPLASVLKWLDFKLDLILHQLMQGETSPHFPHKAWTTDISGSGFGLQKAGGLKPGQKIVVELILPDQPYRPVYAVGEVVRAMEGGSEQAAIGVRFAEISESDRERIIRFTFKEQRRLLAARARDRERADG